MALLSTVVPAGRPKSTTELADELRQGAPLVSFHLSVLRRNGLVTSWRSGRRVLYRRTPLASRLIAAGGPTAGHDRLFDAFEHD